MDMIPKLRPLEKENSRQKRSCGIKYVLYQIFDHIITIRFGKRTRICKAFLCNYYLAAYNIFTISTKYRYGYLHPV